VGSAPTKEDLKFGQPWTGGRPAHILADLMARAGIYTVDDAVYFTNVSKTYQATKTDETINTEANVTELRAELARVKPFLVVTLGALATRAVGLFGDLSVIHGQCFRSPDSPDRTIFPCFDPGLAVRDPSALANMHRDFGILKELLAGGPGHYPTEQVGTDYAVGFDDSHPQRKVIAIDTEGYKDDPWCLTYSQGPGHGRLIWEDNPDELRSFSKYLKQFEIVVFHNAQWDAKVLRSLGIEVPAEKWHDTMLMAYALQLPPQGLKPLALRYCGMKMRKYADVVFPTEQTLWLQYLEEIVSIQDLWKRFDKPEPELAQNADGKYVVKTPQKLQTRIKSIYTKLAKDENVDVKKLWLSIPEGVRAATTVVPPVIPEPKFHFNMLPTKIGLDYACADADATFRLYPCLMKELQDMKLSDTYEMDRQVLPMIESMEADGMPAYGGRKYFHQLQDEFREKSEDIRSQIMKYNEGKWINPNSPKQLASLLFGRLRLPALRRSPKTRAPSTNDKALQEIAHMHKAVKLVQDYRESINLQKFCKLLPEYIHPITERVHTSIKTTRVVSGRYASQDPNLLAIPARTEEGLRIRSGFRCEPGWMLGSADLDQIEMKVMAHLSQDEYLLKCIREGVDLHTATASKLFGIPFERVEKVKHRMPAKTINFGIIYGISAKGLHDQLAMAGLEYDIDQCQTFIDRYLTVVYPGVSQFFKESHARAHRDGYVRTLYGRIRHLPQIWSEFDEYQVAEAERQAVSHEVQGTAQDLMKRAMIRMWHQLKDESWVRFLLQVHDEVIVESVEKHLDIVEQVVVESLEADSSWFSVPITAGMNWSTHWGGLK
jgi:uracil-DNA glycosylase family 4